LKNISRNLLGKRKQKILFRVLLVVFLAFGSTFFNSTPAHAEPVAGLTQDVYTYDSVSTPDRTEYTLCNTGIVPNINFDVGGDVVANCQQDFVLIHWYGYITMPIDGEITFQSFADDGFYLDIDGQNVINDWTLKGCSGNSGTHTFQSGVSQKVDIWWYEYGGGACNFLYYTDPVTAFTLIPDSAWSTEPQEVLPPVIIEPTPIPVDPVDPPVVEPPVVDPPVVEPPVDPIPVDPPVVPEPPVVTPVEPEPKPPVVIPNPPVVVPPTVPTEPEKPIIEPPVEVPTAQESLNTLVDIAPSEMTDAQVAQLQEVAYAVLESSEQGSPEYEKALDALFVAAQADDIEVDPQLAAVPVLGSVAVGITNALNFIGNVGSDMSPKVREESKKIVVSAVVVAQVATTAVMATASVGAGGIRRKPE